MIRRPHKKTHSTAQHRTTPHKTAQGPHKGRTRSAHAKKFRTLEEMSLTYFGNVNGCTRGPKFAGRIFRHVSVVIYRILLVEIQRDGANCIPGYDLWFYARDMRQISTVYNTLEKKKYPRLDFSGFRACHEAATRFTM